MKNSAFNPEVEHDHDMCAGVQEHGHAAHEHMTKHVKGPHNRGFHKVKDHTHGSSDEGGEGMGSNATHE